MVFVLITSGVAAVVVVFVLAAWLPGWMEAAMSMQPVPWPEPAPEVAAAIRAIYRGKRQVPLPVRVRDELGGVFADEAFAGAFGRQGRPGWSPGRLAPFSAPRGV